MSDSRFITIARLDGYRLEFTRFSHRRQGGVADIVPHDGQTMWGVLYEVPESEVSALDYKEGYPNAYKKAKVTVTANDGAKVEATTYIVANKDSERFRPRRQYLRLLIEGAQRWGLPEDYIRFLNAILSVEDDDGSS